VQKEDTIVCVNCDYYFGSEKDGECRFNPPVVVVGQLEDGYQVRSLWPKVEAEAFCGKFEAKN